MGFVEIMADSIRRTNVTKINHIIRRQKMNNKVISFSREGKDECPPALEKNIASILNTGSMYFVFYTKIDPITGATSIGDPRIDSIMELLDDTAPTQHHFIVKALADEYLLTRFIDYLPSHEMPHYTFTLMAASDPEQAAEIFRAGVKQSQLSEAVFIGLSLTKGTDQQKEAVIVNMFQALKVRSSGQAALGFLVEALLIRTNNNFGGTTTTIPEPLLKAIPELLALLDNEEEKMAAVTEIIKAIRRVGKENQADAITAILQITISDSADTSLYTSISSAIVNGYIAILQETINDLYPQFVDKTNHVDDFILFEKLETRDALIWMIEGKGLAPTTGWSTRINSINYIPPEDRI